MSKQRTLIGFFAGLGMIVIPLSTVPRAAKAGALDAGFLQKDQFESGKPRPGAAASATVKPQQTKKKEVLVEISAEPASGTEPKEVSYDTLKSLTQILKTTPIGLRRNTLLLNRAAGMNSYGRRLLLQAKSSENIKKSKTFFTAAIRDSEEVLRTPYKNNEHKARAYSVIGYSYLYLDQSKEARKNFYAALSIDPNSPDNGWIGLYLGEELFDEAQYAQALKYYSTYFQKMSPKAREIALYKSAWCLINLKQNEQAIDSFVRLAQLKSKYGLAKDAMRDVAFLVTHDRDPKKSIEMTEIKFTDSQLRLDFLGYVRESLEHQNMMAIHSEVIDKLLAMEKRPEKKLEYLLANLRVNRRLFATRSHRSAFVRMVEMIKAEKLSPSSPEIKKFADAIEAEVQILMRSFIDTFAGRTKTSDAFTKEELSRDLVFQFEFFVSYLAESKLRSNVVGLWLDVCVDVQNWQCVDSVAERVLEDRKAFATLVERALIDQLGALEQLILLSKDSEKESREKRKIARTEEYIENFQSSPQWALVAKRHVQSFLEAEKFKEAIPLLEKIYLKDPGQDTFYKLQFSKFRTGEYATILADPRWDTIRSPERRLIDLKRETVLALALEAKKKEDAAAYSSYIAQFLKLKPDPAKANIARIDHLKFLMGKNLIEDASRDFLSIGVGTRDLPEFSELKVMFWAAAIERGSYKDALSSLKTANKAKDPQQAYRRLLTRVAAGERPNSQELNQLSEENRDYVLGLLAVTAPDLLIQYLRKNSSGLSQAKDLMMLALRIKTGKWILPKTPETERLLGKGYRFSGPDTAVELPLEKRVKKVIFPSKKAKPKALAQAIEGLVVETRRIRAGVAKAIQDKSPYTQLRLIEAVRDHERKVALTLMESPVPAGLTEEQMTQYQEGLREASKEFVDQASEFDRMAASAREAIGKINSAVEARTLPKPAMKDWPWPGFLKTNPAFKSMNDAIEAKNFLGALMLLDFLRSGHVKGEEDYFKIRTGILLLSSDESAIRTYLRDELESNKQTSIIEDWKKMTSDQPSSEAHP